jgi:hypothetical protein
MSSTTDINTIVVPETYMDPNIPYYNQDRMPMVNHAVDPNGYYIQSHPMVNTHYYNSGTQEQMPMVVDHGMSSAPYNGHGYVYGDNGIINEPYNGQYANPLRNYCVDLNTSYNETMLGDGVNQVDAVANVKPLAPKSKLFRDDDELDGDVKPPNK